MYHHLCPPCCPPPHHPLPLPGGTPDPDYHPLQTGGSAGSDHSCTGPDREHPETHHPPSNINIK